VQLLEAAEGQLDRPWGGPPKSEQAKSSHREEPEMRYLIITNLGLIFSALAVLGKSVWGKSTW